MPYSKYANIIDIYLFCKYNKFAYMKHFILRGLYLMSQEFTYIVIYIIEAFIAYLYLSISYKKKKSVMYSVLITAICYASQFCFSLVGNVTLNMTSFLMFNFILMILAFDITLPACIFNAFVMTTLMTTCELVSGNIIGSIFTSNKSVLLNSNRILMLVITSKALYLLTLFILAMVLRIYHGEKIIYTLENTLLAVIPLLSFVMLIILFYICCSSPLSRLQDFLIVICSICLIIINILVFWIQNYSGNKHREMMKLQAALQAEAEETHYYKMLENHDKEQRILIHDIKNHLAAISAMAQDDESHNIQIYIDHLITAPALNTRIVQTDNTHFNLLMSRYISICQSKHITLNLDIINCKIDYLQPEEITSLFSNLLDNAVSAAETAAEHIIDFKINEKGEHNTIISIDNSCDIPPDYDADNMPMTTKHDTSRHGYGMKSIRRIIDHHDGNIYSHFDEKEHVYHTIINMFH